MNKTSEDIGKLEKIVSKSLGQNDVKFKLEHEVEFHSKLYEITGNETLYRFQRLLLPVFQFVIDEEAHQKKPPKKGKVNHQQLVKIIKNGTPLKFRQGMYHHLKPHFEWLSSQKNQKT